MAKSGDIFVFSEKLTVLAELISGAVDIATQTEGKVIAIVAGSKEDAEQAASYGANEVLWVGEVTDDHPVENFVLTLTDLVINSSPLCMMIGTSKRDKALAGRLAARLGTSVITDINAISLEDGGLSGTHMIFGGGAKRVEKAKTATTLVTVAQGFFEARYFEPRQAAIIEVPYVEPEWNMALRERRVKEAKSVNLSLANTVVGLGRGVRKEEDIIIFREIANILEAEIGCTRPLAEGLNWLPKEVYIGVSGCSIKPNLYLMFGISGQVQHTIGCIDSKVIVAINEDENAPVFQQTDYGIVGDLYQVAQVLVGALKARM